MNKSRIALAAAILLAGTAPILAQPRRRPRPRSRPRARPATAAWASTSPPATRRQARATISTATPTAPGSQPTQIPADRTSWSLWTVLSRGYRAAAARDRRPTPAALERSRPSARSATSTPPGWTRPASRRAASRRCGPISSASTAVRNRDELLDLFATPGYIVAGRRRHHPRISPIRPAMPRSPARAASACRTAIIICARARNMTATAPPIATISSTLHRLAGIADAEAKADAIIALERRIAEAHWTPGAQPRHPARSTIR